MRAGCCVLGVINRGEAPHYLHTDESEAGLAGAVWTRRQQKDSLTAAVNDLGIKRTYFYILDKSILPVSPPIKIRHTEIL